MNERSAPPSFDAERDEFGRFQIGCKPGPGRPKGARSKFCSEFLTDLHEFWRVEGASIMRRAAAQHPTAFLRSMVILARPHTNDAEDDLLAHVESVDEIKATLLEGFSAVFPELQIVPKAAALPNPKRQRP
jgi:hypothetical protein